MDAWCHLRKDVSGFAIHAIQSAEILDTPAKELDLAAMRQQLDASYGIFAGTPIDWAELRFSPARAGWVQHETWHPQQTGTLHADGSYTLRVPYSDERELLGDILRFGAEVQVLAPATLRQKIQVEIKRMTLNIARPVL